MCLTHEDFQADNLVISPEKELFVIDFQQCGIVDPYYALMSAMISADVSPHFATGQIRKYFEGEPPMDFWKLLFFYFASETINGFLAAITLGQEEIDFVYKMTKNTLECFDNMNNPIPTWYLLNTPISNSIFMDV